jgi:hypothetical protein
MSRRISLRLALVVLSAAAVLPLATRSQSQDPQTESVAEAARRAREQKKAAAKQPAPVITDDTLKPSAPAAPAASPAAPPANPSAPAQSPDAVPAPAGTPAAQAPSAAENAAAQPIPSASPDNSGNVNQKAKDSAELTGLKQRLAEAQKGLDLLQRDFALQQDTYFSNPDHSHDTAGKAKLDATNQQIADKQQEVDDLKARVAALEGSLGITAPAAPAMPAAPAAPPTPQP